MDKTQRQTIVAFSAVPDVGRATLERLQKSADKYHLSWSEMWHGGEGELSVYGLKPQQCDNALLFRKTYSPTDYDEVLQSKKIVTVLATDPEYPHLLKEIHDKPFLLFVKGPLNFWNEKPVAVVGTRRITEYGTFVTEKISRELVELGATIISGFMYGVDVTAHRAAMDANGKSVGVLGFGFDHLYPRNQERLFDEFLAKGNTFITEFAPEVAPCHGTFPMRNRVVAGLSKAVVVTEAAEGSGSFITVQCALDYNRSVCAVPGPISSIFTAGTRALINDGAKLVSTGVEVMEEAGLLESLTLP